MKPERWQVVKAMFDAALDRAPAERASFLDETCAADRELRAAVDALLAANEASGDFLDPPVHGAAAALLSRAADREGVGEQIGRYRLVELRGSGGMATVYKAVRAGGEDDRPVAVKVIKPGMASDNILRRFRRERQFLARLKHPNIAEFLDGGATENGTPYLVMEYIEGKPIEEYCDAHELSVPARLEMFRVVCAAVQHAHRSLVVHRDLKPGHILVTEDGTPKLVDFGIAKIVKGDALDDTQTITETAARFLTPQYASPEQIRGEPVTTCSDVYSLGVILYELLTGHRPYHLGGRSPREFERLICERGPDRPSTVVARVDETVHHDGTIQAINPDAVSRSRDTHPRDLQRRLRGDLDTIVLTAMHRDRRMRYGSVAQLSDDIGRHLAGMPVFAHRDSFTYRMTKFVRRNKIAVTAAAFAVLALIAGVIGTSVGLVRTSRALRLAEDEAAKARQINDFLQETLETADAGEAGRDVAMREVLDAAAARLENLPTEYQDVRGDLHTTIGKTYRALGDYAQAERHLTLALELRCRTRGSSHPEVAMAKNQLGMLFRMTGDFDSAERAYQEAIDILHGSPGHNPIDLAKILNNFGNLHSRLGHYDHAERMFRQSAEAFQACAAQSDPDYPAVLHNLAFALRKKADYAAADKAYREAISIQRNRGPRRDPYLATMLCGHAGLLRDRGELNAAEELYREALALLRAAFGPDHPQQATVLTDLGSVYMLQGRYPEAEGMLSKALSIFRTVHGNEHAEVATCLNNLAALRRETGDYARAQDAFREALGIQRHVLGDRHEQVGIMLCNLGDLHRVSGDLDSAERCFREAIDIFHERWGNSHPHVGMGLNGLGTVQIARGAHAEARRLIEEGLAIRRQALPPGHPAIANSLCALGEAALARGAPLEAEPVLRECLSIRREGLPDGHRFTAVASSLLGEALTHLGRYAEAEPLLLDGEEMLSESPGMAPRDAAEIRRRLVRLYEAWGKPEQAAAVSPLRSTLSQPQ